MERSKAKGNTEKAELPPLPPCTCPAQCEPRERHGRGRKEQQQSDFDRWLIRMQRQVARCSALAQFEKMARARQYADQLVARCQPLRTGPEDWRTSEENCQRRGPAMEQAENTEYDAEERMKRLRKNLETLDLCTKLSIDAVRELATIEDALED